MFIYIFALLLNHSINLERMYFINITWDIIDLKSVCNFYFSGAVSIHNNVFYNAMQQNTKLHNTCQYVQITHIIFQNKIIGLNIKTQRLIRCPLLVKYILHVLIKL